MKTATWGSGLRWDDPNLRWGDPSYVLEPGDPGYVPPSAPPTTLPATKKKRNYMAPLETRIEVLASGASGVRGHDSALERRGTSGRANR